MARSKEEIISDMVDAGMSDDEIRSAFKPTGPTTKIGKAWEALKIPEQMSREGLTQLAGMVPNPEPTGKEGMVSKAARLLSPIPLDFIPEGTMGDIARGTPKIMADTMAEAAPGFVSRGSIATAGAMKALGAAAPILKPIARSLGSQAEELSGIAPRNAGALERAYDDPTRIFSKGKKAAGQFYEAAKDEMEAGRNTYRATSMNGDDLYNMKKTKDIFEGMYKPEQILDRANQFIQGGGKMEPVEALKVRKAIDILLRSRGHVPDELHKMRELYDDLAKASGNIEAGDLTYQRGRDAEALRNIFPQNKYGGTSAFKVGIMTGLENMGTAGKLAKLIFSPALQGAAATGAGVVARGAVGPMIDSAPVAMAAFNALQEALKRRRQTAAH